MKIIVDAYGGDNAPREIIKGACMAASEYGVEIILVGKYEETERIIYEEGFSFEGIEIVNASDTVKMDDDPMQVMQKNDSSMSVALHLLANGGGDALVSAGSTGALFAGGTLIVRKQKGVLRAAIGAILPMSPPVLILDSGANLTVSPKHLLQFAVMGSEMMRNVYGIKKPRVGLLNNGSESCKGNELQREAYVLLSDADNINFVGNVEADKIPFNACDVVICDGFTGNILLKSIEGMGKMMLGVVKSIFMKNPVSKLSALLVGSDLSSIKKKYNPKEHGGAPILGLSKPVIKAHGSSDAKNFKNAIKQAILFAEAGVSEDIGWAVLRDSERKALEKLKAEK